MIGLFSVKKNPLPSMFVLEVSSAGCILVVCFIKVKAQLYPATLIFDYASVKLVIQF